MNVGLDLHYDLLSMEEVCDIVKDIPYYVQYQEEDYLRKDYAFFELIKIQEKREKLLPF